VYVGYRRPRWGLGLKPKSGISLIYIESGQREKKKLSRQMAELIETSSSVFGSITNVVIKLMWKVGYLGLGGGFLVTGLLYAKQNSMLYMPGQLFYSLLFTILTVHCLEYCTIVSLSCMNDSFQPALIIFLARTPGLFVGCATRNWKFTEETSK